MKKIRADYEAGKTTYEALKEAEDTAIRDLVAKQKAAGYKLLTDGEFRRKTWYLDFMWGFEGVSHSAPRGGIPFHDVLAVVDDTYLTGKLKLTGTHPFGEHSGLSRRLRTKTPSQSRHSVSGSVLRADDLPNERGDDE